MRVQPIGQVDQKKNHVGKGTDAFYSVVQCKLLRLDSTRTLSTCLSGVSRDKAESKAAKPLP